MFIKLLFSFAVLISCSFASGRGTGPESECVKYLRTSAFPEAGVIAKQLMLSQVKKSSLDEYFKINYIDRIRAEYATAVPFLSPIKVTGFGPHPDPHLPEPDHKEINQRAYYLNIKNKKNLGEILRIEIFSRSPEVEIIISDSKKFERYLLSSDDYSCIPLSKYSGSAHSKLVSETDTAYCSEIKDFYKKQTEFENKVGLFNYDKCEADKKCRQSAKEIYEARYRIRPQSYLQSTARNDVSVDEKMIFKHARDIKRDYNDQCTELLKESSSQLAKSKREAPGIGSKEKSASVKN